VKIALLGAPGTGKTWLALALITALRSRGRTAQLLAPGEQDLPHFDDVIADTTGLLAAVERDIEGQDKSLYPGAFAEQAQFDLTLLTGLDLPHAHPERQQQVDARLREALHARGLRYSVVYGVGDQRCASALAAIDQWTNPGSNHFGAGQARWQWVCDKCSDAQCEHQLFTALLDQAPGKN